MVVVHPRARRLGVGHEIVDDEGLEQKAERLDVFQQGLSACAKRGGGERGVCEVVLCRLSEHHRGPERRVPRRNVMHEVEA